MRRKGGFVYLTFSKKNGTIYTGVTYDIIRRMYEHKNKIFKGFTYRYNVDKLGYYEYYEDINTAIAREKAIKDRSRKYKLNLIESYNPEWLDLTDELEY